MMKIRLSDIAHEGLNLQCEMEPATLDLEDTGVQFSEPIHVQSRLVMMDRTAYLTGEAGAPARFQCVRCLETVPFVFQTSFQMNVEPQETASGKTPGELRELHREELDEHYYSGDVIDLTEVVREQILLALPAYPLCRADCRGLCPRCGGDLNCISCRCSIEDTRPPMTQFQERLKKIIKK